MWVCAAMDHAVQGDDVSGTDAGSVTVPSPWTSRLIGHALLLHDAASVSFGSERDFVLRNNADRANKLTFPLGGGAVLVMGGHTQTYWQHAVPKRAKSGPRISLTFRNITLPEKP